MKHNYKLGQHVFVIDKVGDIVLPLGFYIKEMPSPQKIIVSNLRVIQDIDGHWNREEVTYTVTPDAVFPTYEDAYAVVRRMGRN